MTIKRTYRDELEKLDDAIDESILAASSDELREELAALGMDPDAVVAEMDAVTGRARIAGAKRSLEQAKRAVLAFKAMPADVSPEDRDAVRRKLGEMRAGDGAKASDMMMAARKGKGLSDSDEQGILDDLARLARLEAEDPDSEHWRSRPRSAFSKSLGTEAFGGDRAGGHRLDARRGRRVSPARSLRGDHRGLEKEGGDRGQQPESSRSAEVFARA